jgi:DNA-directed RNA polymerase specialized sigma subunit
MFMEQYKSDYTITDKDIKYLRGVMVNRYKYCDEDLLQDSLLNALRVFDPTKGASFRTFAFRCYINAQKAYHKKNKLIYEYMMKDMDTMDVQWDTKCIEYHEIDNEILDKYEWGLDFLEKNKCDYMELYLFCVENKCIKDITKQLNQNINTTKTKMRHKRIKLQTEYLNRFKSINPK